MLFPNFGYAQRKPLTKKNTQGKFHIFFLKKALQTVLLIWPGHEGPYSDLGMLCQKQSGVRELGPYFVVCGKVEVGAGVGRELRLHQGAAQPGFSRCKSVQPSWKLVELSGFALLTAWPVFCTGLELQEIWATEPAGPDGVGLISCGVIFSSF